MRLLPPGYITLSEAIDRAGAAWFPEEWSDCAISVSEMHTLLRHAKARKVDAKEAGGRQPATFRVDSGKLVEQQMSGASTETDEVQRLFARHGRRQKHIGSVWARLRQELAAGRLQAECFYPSGEHKLVPNYVWRSEANDGTYRSNLVLIIDGSQRTGGEPIFAADFLIASNVENISGLDPKSTPSNQIEHAAAKPKMKEVLRQAMRYLSQYGLSPLIHSEAVDLLYQLNYGRNAARVAAKSISRREKRRPNAQLANRNKELDDLRRYLSGEGPAKVDG